MAKASLEFTDDELIYLGGALTFMCAWISDDKLMGMRGATICRIALERLGDKGAGDLVNRITDAIRDTHPNELQ